MPDEPRWDGRDENRDVVFVGYAGVADVYYDPYDDELPYAVLLSEQETKDRDTWYWLWFQYDDKVLKYEIPSDAHVLTPYEMCELYRVVGEHDEQLGGCASRKETENETAITV